jgi:hypothetical protein
MGDEAEVTHGPCFINININLSESKKSLVLKHEVFEIINNEHELNLEHHKIMTLGFEWHQVTTDNPGVFWMTEFFNIKEYENKDIMIELKEEQWQRMILSEAAQDDLLNYLLIKRREMDEWRTNLQDRR